MEDSSEEEVEDSSEEEVDGLEEEELDKPEPKQQVEVGSSKRPRGTGIDASQPQVEGGIFKGVRSGITLGEQSLRI